MVKHSKPAILSWETLRARSWLAGTVSSPAALERAAQAAAVTPAWDLLEVRLDRIAAAGETDWAQAVTRIERQVRPVLVTIRLASEGGAWSGADLARAPAYARALETASAVDVEWRSLLAADIAAEAARRGQVCVVSLHDFDRTPSQAILQRTIERMRSGPPVVVKIAAMVRDAADVDTLARTLEWARADGPVCMIGMGGRGAATRVDFARRGSCLTYGWIDEPTAPGQPSAADLRALLDA